ncbi:hypothetical protein AB0I60_03455 [Actinosynnema sp. NPDC050436]|uniref:hypothetical protein n=1 Tax=Actinosynnema sp. NPDC050436 TaxID=3155659 RepID=UPI0033FCB355
MGLRARVWSVAAVVVVLVSGSAVAVAAPYTRQFRGEGDSSFGFAWIYARADARSKAVGDGFTDPEAQCAEISATGTTYDATVAWECTR